MPLGYLPWGAKIVQSNQTHLQIFFFTIARFYHCNNYVLKQNILCFNLFIEYFYSALSSCEAPSAPHSHLQHWLCYLGNTRVTTAHFWCWSVIFSFHSVNLYYPSICHFNHFKHMYSKTCD
jgi:hypothetical protein